MKEGRKLSVKEQFPHTPDLVFLMGEELKKPLTLITMLAEQQAGNRLEIKEEARRALRTIDNVLLYRRIVSEQLTLSLSPIHVGSVLAAANNSLMPLSHAFGCETEIFIQSGIAAADADKEVLRAGIESLWQAMLGLTTKSSALTWRVQRKAGGILVIVTNKTVDLTGVSLSPKAVASRQPFKGLAGPATDLLTAYGLFSSIGGKLAPYRSKQGSGFSLKLQRSQQLSLV